MCVNTEFISLCSRRRGRGRSSRADEANLPNLLGFEVDIAFGNLWFVEVVVPEEASLTESHIALIIEKEAFLSQGALDQHLLSGHFLLLLSFFCDKGCCCFGEGCWL